MLLSVWLRSGTKSNDLWQHLVRLFPDWSWRLPVITQWGQFTHELTRHAISIMYENAAGIVTINWNMYALFCGAYFSDGVDISLDFSTDYIVYIWYRFLYLPGYLENINDPLPHFHAHQIIHQLVDLFLQIPREQEDVCL